MAILMPCVPHAAYSPTYFMDDDNWLSRCQVFIRLVPHDTCSYVMCCHVIRPLFLEIHEILTILEFQRKSTTQLDFMRRTQRYNMCHHPRSREVLKLTTCTITVIYRFTLPGSSHEISLEYPFNFPTICQY